MSNNYWLVGAAFGGTDDVLPFFLERGYWYCWDPNSDFADASSANGGNSIKAQQERFSRIKKGDRIAVKKIASMTNQEMDIRAIGIVKDVDIEEWRVYVDWLPLGQSGKELNRQADLKGCVASIHGPFQNDDPWIRQIFCV